MDDVEMIVCQKCQRPTCDPPDDLIEFKGMCPGCVIRQEVLPLIPARFAELIDGILESRDEVIVEKVLDQLTGDAGIAIVVRADTGEDFLDKFKALLMDSQEIRDRFREVLDEIEKNPPLKVKKNMPVVRNDPRTG